MRLKDSIRRRMKGLHRTPIEFKHVRALIDLAVSRPVDLLSMQDEIIRLAANSSEATQYIESALQVMDGNENWEAECRNIVVATIRANEIIDVNSAMDFGMMAIPKWPDQRGIASLVTMLEREGRQHHALDILEYSPNLEWANRKRDSINSAIGLLGMDEMESIERIEKVYLNHVGMDYLKIDPAPAVMLYADVNMNIIDGSSVWLSSIVEAFSGTGFEVHVLLKKNIERDLLVGHLSGMDGVRLLEPHMFGLPDEELSTMKAVDIIEVLDGIHGGYRCIVLRGMDLCTKAGAKKSLWRRIWAYLTDYYQVDEIDGLIVSEENQILLNDLKHVFEYFLIQTEELGKNLERIGVEPSMLRLLPPVIPDRMVNTKTPKSSKDGMKPLKIGYCGKMAPLWGVRELIQKAEDSTRLGKPIEVHIIGDKIHRSCEMHPDFNQEMKRLLRESPVVTWHGAMERDRSVEMLATMDLGWCYRSPLLENHTLELSTKLLEHLAIGLPFIVTKNRVNEELLGADYPYFVDDENGIEDMIEQIIEHDVQHFDSVGKLSVHLISSVTNDILTPLLMSGFNPEQRGHRVVVAGNDLKFLSQFESHLKRMGCIVRRDEWGWGEPQFIQRSKALLQWAEFVWCEWSLANAVWYSNNLRENQKMVVRLHLQEIGERASKFSREIDIDRVDRVIVVAEHVRQEAIKLFEWDDDKTVFIPNFIESERLRHDRRGQANKKIGIIGIVPQRKRLDIALDLLEKLREEDDEWELIIKGRVPKDYPWMFGPSRRKEMEFYDEQYRRMENNERLRGAVKFEGYTLTISEFYTKIGYVLSPSDFESFHYSIADGVSSGSFPVIWPWEGADDLYPEEWVVQDTKDAVKKMVAYAEETVDERNLQASIRAEIIRDRYDFEKVFPQLTEALLSHPFQSPSTNNQVVSTSEDLEGIEDE